MTQSQALTQLMDAADLVAMLEELTRPGSNVQLTSTTVSGLRVTLRTVREILIDSHDMLAKNLVEKSRETPRAPTMNTGIGLPRQNLSGAGASTLGADAEPSFRRKDLRSSIDRVGE